MVADNTELGRPPEFPSDGDPPTESAPIVRSELVRSVTLRRRPTLREFALVAVKSIPGLTIDLGPINSQLDTYRSWSEPRRIVFERFWKREELHQLAPGVSTEQSVTLAVGVTQSATQEIATSLGIDVGGEAVGAKVTARMEEKIGQAIEFSRQHSVTTTVTLSNPSETQYRRIAVWSVANRIHIERIDGIELTREFSEQELEQVGAIRALWQPVARVQWTTGSSVQTTSIDVGRADEP